MPITYKDAGVDTHAGQDFVKQIKAFAKKTHGPEVLSGIGGFAALFAVNWQQYKEPVLVSGTDGVGTKLHIAQKMDVHNTIGQDLVAMCLNDILTIGAKPLFFLDYLVTNKLDSKIHTQVIQGIALACEKSGMALIGGETAEHPHEKTPGLPKQENTNHYDLAGFAVGIVDKENILPGGNVQPGDTIWGLPSSGLHSNGFSLVRKILADKNLDIHKNYGLSQSLGNVLLEPTRLYHKHLPYLAENKLIKAAAHITGGGFYENIPRILPHECVARISTKSIPEQEIFSFLAATGPIAPDEMYKTFNMGVGMVLISSEDCRDQIQKLCPESFILGSIEKRPEGSDSLIFHEV